MPTVGEKLRQARLAADRQLADISDETKIRPHYLQCLEEDNYDELPAQYCAIPFLRQYALAVDLDPEELVSEIRSELPTEEISIPEVFRVSATPRGSSIARASQSLSRLARRRAAALGKVAIALALIAGGFMWWIRSAQNGNGANPQGTEISAPASTESGAVGRSAHVETSETSETPPETVESVPSSPPAPAGVASASIAIDIQATDQVWVRSLTDGVTERSRMMNSGEVQRIEADALVNLTFGNAGAVSLAINGEVQEGIGNAGEVKHLRITRSGWEFISSDSY